jgi:beta-lactamase regulating signal transducer with metallopeptidase domain
MSAPQLAAVFAVLVDAALRGSVILLAALAATRLMKGRSAASRHLVWVVALLSMLALPLVARVLPEWRVVPVPAPLRPMAGFVAAPAAVAPPAVSVLSESPTEGEVGTLSTATPKAPSPAARAASPAPAAPAPFDWKSALMALWMAGGALVVLRLAYGIVRVWWMERRAVEITDDGWVRIADGLARRLRVGRVVTLLREAHAVVPMTWGVVRPIVLLPADAEAWDTERRTVVLAHELAHVRRWDTLTQWVAHLALALFWFNPLVWMAARQVREEREHACDDAVLSIGTRPVEYADHLLDIVRSLGSAEGPAAALAMARRSQFEGRLLAILDNATPRGGVSRGLGFAALVLAAAAVLPLGALRAARPAEALASPRAAANQTALSAPPRERPGKYPLASMPGKLARIVDRALDAIPGRDTAATPLIPVAALRESPASGASAAGAASSPYARTVTAPPAPPESPAPPPQASVVLVFAGALGIPQSQAAAMLRDSGAYGDVIRAAAGITSPPERASVLLAVLRQPDLSAADLASLLRVAGGIASDPSRRDVLEEAARRHSLSSAEVRRAFFTAAAGFVSTPERRDVLMTVLSRSGDPEVVAAAILSARAMPSDPERRDVLLKAAERAGSPELLLQVVNAAREVVSSPARRDLLVKVLSRPALPTGVLRAVFGAAAEIAASPEKKDVLVYAAEHQRLDAAAREAYLSAAGTIASSPERADAVAAVLGGREAGAAAPRPTTTTTHIHTDDDDGLWNSDIELTSDAGRVVRIRARQVERGADAAEIRTIHRGGSVMVEETVRGETRRLDMVPAAGSSITRSYRVNGQPRPFDAAAERWVASILREFTQAAK